MRKIQQFDTTRIIRIIFSVLLSPVCLFSKPLKNNELTCFNPPTATLRIEHHTLESHTTPLYCFNNNGTLLTRQGINRLLPIPITKELGGDEITIKGVADSTTCLKSYVRFTVSNLKAVGCAAQSPPSVSVSDSRFRLTDTVWAATIQYNFMGEEQFFNIVVSDACGNTTTQRVKMIFEDNTPPRAVTNRQLLTVPSGQRSVLLRVTDIGSNSTDNCGVKSLMMRLADAPSDTCWTNTLELNSPNVLRTTYNVVVRVLDKNDMASEKTTTVTIENELREPSYGSVTNAVGTAIDNVTILASSGSNSLGQAQTAINGSFGFLLPSNYSNLTISATKTDTSDAHEGVSTADISAISRQVLGTQNLSSPYSIIAADVNKDGIIDAIDMILLRRFVLFINRSLPAGNFRFVAKSYVFQNPNFPLNESFPEVVTLANPQTPVDLNFTAVKIGDVNNSFRHISVRSGRTLTLKTDDREVEAGKTYTVTIKAEQFDAAAFQCTLSCKGLIIKDFEAGNLTNMSNDNFGQFKNALTMSWNGAITEGGYDVVKLTVLAQETGRLSQFLSFGSALTPAEAIAENGEGRTLVLRFNSDKLLNNMPSDKLMVYQNTPNPTAGTTRIGFYLPNETTAKLTIFNTAGQLILRKNGRFSAGQNEFILQKTELTTGVLYYQIEAMGQKMVKKMVVLD